ncbi:MAG: glucan 1,4-alpha-glucosidase, partial [Terriglobales bacterium]
MIPRLLVILLVSSLCAAQVAPGAPGERPTWTNGNKVGVGTSNTLESKVWFTLGEGVLQEVYYPTIDKANTRTLELLVTDGRTFIERESTDTTHAIEVPDAAALVFRQVNTSKSGRYRITKTYITDPQQNTVLIQVLLQTLKPGVLRLYVLFDPAVNNSGLYDTGYSLRGALIAADSGIAAALASSVPFVRTSSGYLGTSDGATDLKDNFRLDHTYVRAASGNVVQVAELPASAVQGAAFTLALGFGSEGATALTAAKASLAKSFAAHLKQYAGGWREYLGTLKTVDAKYRDQYQMAAMVLKAHEDKTWRGAGAASLTVPWGHQADASEPSVGGYHLVWSRDLYQVATAFAAMGDKESADRALNYLFKVQQKKDGSFPQNSWLDGRPFWGSLQLDEVAYPLILAYQLGRTDGETYERHVKPAAEFIVKNGPATPQERWEEEGGYSPSTIAAEIAGLVCAAEIARRHGDNASADRWLATADLWARDLDSWTVTTTGPHGASYYARITQKGTPNTGEKLEINNGGGRFDEREIVDAGFLELVRLGIRRADDPLIKKSLEVVDKIIKVATPRGPGWYRYNRDGYGEKSDGRGYDGTGVGRLWPLLTGERGEYVLAAGGDARPYLDALMQMSNDGRMLPEQVWDRSDSPAPHLEFGEGTGSATPLAWTNAQFVRLAIAIQEGKLPETPDVVRKRYLEGGAGALFATEPAPDISDKKFAERIVAGPSPIVTGQWVTFAYRGTSKEVELVGEFTDWNRRGMMLRTAPSGVRYLSLNFPADARIEYKFVVDGQWQLDPLNPQKNDNGVGGENNHFSMPEYRRTKDSEERPGLPHGRLEDLKLPAGMLGERPVKVYLPPGYDSSDQRYPAIYFGDGLEYISRAKANLIADNLIAQKRMQPVIMVFAAPL